MAPPFETMELPRVEFLQAPTGRVGARAAHGPAGLQGAPGDHWDAMEPEWIRRAQQGDREAFERLMQLHDPCVRRVIAAIMHPRFGRSEEDRAEVWGEVWTRALVELPRMYDETRLCRFVQGIARRACWEWCRAHKRRARTLLEVDLPPSLQFMLDHVIEGRPEDLDSYAVVEREELCHNVRLFLQAMPDTLRIPLVLNLEGAAYREIALCLGIKQGTVKSRIHRAWQWVRDREGELAELVGEATEEC